MFKFSAAKISWRIKESLPSLKEAWSYWCWWCSSVEGTGSLLGWHRGWAPCYWIDV